MKHQGVQDRPAAVPVKSAPESRCGSCGYIVKEATGLTCPECGSDLRVVGITTSAPQRSWNLPRLDPPRRKLVILTCACLLAWWVLAYPFDWYVWPSGGTSTHTVTMYPASGKYQRIVLSERREMHRAGSAEDECHEWTGDEGPERCPRIDITAEIYQADRQPLVMQIDGKNGQAWRFDLTGGGTVKGAALDVDAVLEWMAAAGVDTSDAQVRKEAQEVANVVGTSVTSPYNFRGYPWRSQDRQPIGRLERVLYADQDEVNGARAGPAFPRHTGSAASAKFREVPLWAVSALPAGLLWATGVSWVLLPRRTRIKSGSRTLTLLFSDVKDFTAQTAGSSRERVIELINQHRTLVEGPTRGHHGRVVKTIGDAVLAVFDSATDAVLAATEIQRDAGAHNESVPAADRLELRIALSTGEVTVHADDVYGSPVNIASRLQSHAPAGEVYFTEATRQAINEAEVPSARVGPMELKGVAAPVLVYRAVPRCIGNNPTTNRESGDMMGQKAT